MHYGDLFDAFTRLIVITKKQIDDIKVKTEGHGRVTPRTHIVKPAASNAQGPKIFNVEMNGPSFMLILCDTRPNTCRGTPEHA